MTADDTQAYLDSLNHAPENQTAFGAARAVCDAYITAMEKTVPPPDGDERTWMADQIAGAMMFTHMLVAYWDRRLSGDNTRTFARSQLVRSICRVADGSDTIGAQLAGSLVDDLLAEIG